MRQIIHEADPEIVEEWKWRGVPVWSHDGFICTREVYKYHVKMTFPKGASLEDPSGLFNASLEGNAWRAIDIQDRISDSIMATSKPGAIHLRILGGHPKPANEGHLKTGQRE